jgi:hypothetical protein
MQPLSGFTHSEIIEIAKDQDAAVTHGELDDGAANRPCDLSANQRLVLQFTVRSKDVAIAGLLTNPPPISAI